MNNITILEKFISDITGIDINILKNNLIFNSNELPIGRYNDKAFRCDFIITLKTSKDYIFNIELNYYKFKKLIERNYAYVSSLFSSSFKKGKNYYHKTKIYQININCFKENNYLSIDKCYVKRSNNNIYVKNLEIINLNIVNSSKLYYNLINEENNYIPKHIRWGTLIYNKDDRLIEEIGKNILSKKERLKTMSDLKGFKSEDILLSKEEAKIWGEMYTDIIYNEGISNGIKQKEKDNIIAMYKNNIDISVISKIVGKDKSYIKRIIN